MSNQSISNEMRLEQDSLGEMEIEGSKLFGIHTQRSIENFPIRSVGMHPYLIQGMIQVKKAAAMTHIETEEIKLEIGQAIVSACDVLLDNYLAENYPVSIYQGGAGTSTHMNVNEVIANKALEILGHPLGSYEIIHPINDVNRSQSTNDVYPTALRIGLIKLLRETSQVFSELQTVLQSKENEYAHIIKLGRTQWMDALPIMLGQEFGAYAQGIARDRWRIYKVEERLRQVNIGGTAIGTGLNATRKYSVRMIENLRKITGMGLARAEYPIDVTQNQDIFVEVSGLLKAASVNLFKMANDIRIMASGPRGGLGELKLQPLQAGSSIMPGKVNPVIPEMIMTISMKIQANDVLITQAASMGNFELNPFLPIIGEALMESLQLLKEAIPIWMNKCLLTLEVDEIQCQKHLMDSTVLATALVPYLGYDKVALISKEALASRKSIQEIILEQGIMEQEALNKIFNPYQLTKPGIAGK